MMNDGGGESGLDGGEWRGQGAYSVWDLATRCRPVAASEGIEVSFQY